MFTVEEVPARTQFYDTAITGLRFEPNFSSTVRVPDGCVETTIFSNPGSILGHFVTHAPDFQYSTFGIHVGQTDCLTFYSYLTKRIVGYFIDCRCQSPNRGLRVSVAFDTDVKRKLIIPSGVAHAFADIGGVITRNDLLLFASANSSNWNLLNDDIVFPWTEEGIDTAPNVTTNELEIPLAAGTLFYRLQQVLLRGGSGSYAPHSQVSPAKPSTEIARDEVPLPSLSEELCDCQFELNSFSSISTNSWMVIANTPSCVMGLVIIELHRDVEAFTYSTDRNLLHTFLDREGSAIQVELFDLRSDSPTFKMRTSRIFYCDPRFHLRIPAGVAYRYIGSGKCALRVEQELLSETAEPALEGIDPLGCRSIRETDLQSFAGVRPPPLQIAPELQQVLARREFGRMARAENISRTA